MLNQTIDSKLLFASSSINNALNNEAIQALLETFGYNSEVLNVGKELYTKTESLHTKQKKEYGEQYAATDKLNEVLALANHRYMQDLKVARIGLKGNRAAREAMLLGGRRKESLSGWLKQTHAFYTNALELPEVLSAMARFNRTKEHLEEGQAMVNAVEQAYAVQLKEKGEAQNATPVRDDAFDDLQEWMSDFVGIARIALEAQPQYLEILGIVKK